MNERDEASQPNGGVGFWIADAAGAAASGASVAAGPFVVPGLRQAVSTGRQGAAFKVSRLVVAARGA
jgi:hypothetical protein